MVYTEVNINKSTILNGEPPTELSIFSMDVMFKNETVTTYDEKLYQSTLNEAIGKIKKKLRTTHVHRGYSVEIRFYFENCVIDVEEMFDTPLVDGKNEEDEEEPQISFWRLLSSLETYLLIYTDSILLHGIKVEYSIDSCICKNLELTGISKLCINNSEVLRMRVYDAREIDIKNSRVYCETLFPLNDNNTKHSDLKCQPKYYSFALIQTNLMCNNIIPYRKKYGIKVVNVDSERFKGTKNYNTPINVYCDSLRETIMVCENSSVLIYSTLFDCYVAYDVTSATRFSDIYHLAGDDTIIKYNQSYYAAKTKFRDNYIEGNRLKFSKGDISSVYDAALTFRDFSMCSDFDGDVVNIFAPNI